MSRIKITRGRIIDPLNQTDCIGTICIADGIIVSTGNIPDGFQPEQVIDAHQHIVCPGFIELSARLREPGQTREATIASETRAAASGGFSTLCVPPDTQPIIDTPAVAELIKETSASAGFPQVFPIGALTQRLDGKELSSMHALKKAGCIAVSNAQYPLSNPLTLCRAMEYAATHDLLLIYRAEDHWLKNNGCAHKGAVATRFGLPGIPQTAETIAMAQCLELVCETGCRVHFAQLSCARSVEMLEQAKKNSLPVTADTAMHQLHLTEDDLKPFDGNYHVIPPLRTLVDRAALRQAVANGVIDSVCSDHQPHNLDAKMGAFPVTEPGISSLESLLPLLLELVNAEVFSLAQGIRTITANPAKILGLSTGTLTVGRAADISIIAPNLEWTIDNDNWLSQGKNTPFLGKTMQGRVTHTIQAGRLIYQLDKKDIGRV